MKRASPALLLPALGLAAALAACNRQESAPKPAPAPAAPAATAASAPAAPTGPIIAPVAFAPPSDAQRASGATLATQGAQGAAACNSCHGAQGEGNAAAGFPRLAGQSYVYLLHQLESYAQGSRKHPVMQPIAAAMTADQRVAAAAYFASLAPNGPAPRAAVASAPAGGRGALLATVGDETKGVQACVNCHGPGGVGSGELYPYLGGQHASYLSATLGAWRDGSRNNDPSAQMPLIAKSLTPQDVSAVAAYYAAQPLRPSAVDAERMAATGFTPAPAVTSGPQVATAATTGGGGVGTGSEQGSAITGGQQGAGSGGGTGTASTGNPQAAASAGR